jgi:hypothetical protein
MPACLQCNEEFPPAPVRGKPQTFWSRTCQSKAANARRSTTRAGRKGMTNPRPSSPTPPALPSAVDMSPSDRPTPRAERISTLMALAHSRGGIGPWEVAELARLRGISPWAPLSVIIAKERP